MVVFNAVEEFLAELEKDQDLVERKIVRLTCLYQQSTMTPVIRHLFVVATYKAGGEIVQFKDFCGDLWNLEQDEKTIQRSVAIQEKIEEASKEYGLEIRAGMYTEKGEETSG